MEPEIGDVWLVRYKDAFGTHFVSTGIFIKFEALSDEFTICYDYLFLTEYVALGYCKNWLWVTKAMLVRKIK